MSDDLETASAAVEIVPVFERHRALVRETDKNFSRLYGSGGAAVLGAGALTLLIAWTLGAVSMFLPWMLAVTATLVALFILRNVVNKRRAALRDRVEQYCQLNELDWQELRDYYANEGIYPYFLSVLTQEKGA